MFGREDAKQGAVDDVRGWGRLRCQAMNVILSIKAKYFGIEVDLLYQLNQCSLVRFEDRSFVVDTADLVLERNFKQTAGAAKSSRAA
jgi:hypothetical protein